MPRPRPPVAAAEHVPLKGQDATVAFSNIQPDAQVCGASGDCLHSTSTCCLHSAAFYPIAQRLHVAAPKCILYHMTVATPGTRRIAG